MTLKQTRLARFPSGDSKPIAVPAAEPASLERLVGLTFSSGLDDLGNYQFVAVQARPRETVLLIRYQDNPFPGTEVLADRLSDSGTVLANLLDALPPEARRFDLAQSGIVE